MRTSRPKPMIESSLVADLVRVKALPQTAGGFAVADLRTAIVLDYQNMHLSGFDLYRKLDFDRKLHDTLLEPTRFANALLAARNKGQQRGRPRAVLSRVEVFRGLPTSLGDPRRSYRVLHQQENWQLDPRVTVTLRPLRNERGPHFSKYRAFEKGIDVLCTLALLRLARADDVDLVILASHDSDLKPALDAAIDLGAAKIETCAWTHPQLSVDYRRLLPTQPRRVWHTRLQYVDFKKSFDPTVY
jgi:uncharacterized LabA/DUF88 family protein